MKSCSYVEVTWLAQRPFLIFGMMILNENFADTERGQTIHEIHANWSDASPIYPHSNVWFQLMIMQGWFVIQLNLCSDWLLIY